MQTIQTIQALAIAVSLTITSTHSILYGADKFTEGIRDDSAIATAYGLALLLSGCAILGTLIGVTLASSH